MREFFKGWRRKAGVVTLIGSLALAGVWIRSRSIFDAIRIPQNGTMHAIISSQETLAWGSYRDIGRGDAIKGSKLAWQSDPIMPPPPGFVPIADAEHYEWRFMWRGFDFYKVSSDLQSRITWTLPYWSVVIPLTLLSTYLLLVKPPVTKSKSPSENPILD